ncbi:MAG: protein kinase [Polyangiaceae bacterium]
MIPIRYNVRSLWARRLTSIATMVGVALVTLVLAASMMLARGVESTLSSAARDDVAVILRKGSEQELSSSIEETSAQLVLASSELHRAGDKVDAASELVVVVALQKVGSVGVSNVVLRGVDDGSFRMRPSLKIVEGRLPSPGTEEAMVGRRIRGRMQGLELGQSIELRRNRPITIVGVFESDGDSSESEMWTSRDTLQACFGRLGSVSSMRISLPSSDAFEGFRHSIESDMRLGLSVERESVFQAKQSQGLSLFIRVMGLLISVLFSIGAMIGATITLHGAIASRQREIGTLRALGFSRRSILLSFLFEALLLTGVGGALGALFSLPLALVKISMINYATWSELVFRFSPTPSIVLSSISFSMAMGLLGGMAPALRAARVSPSSALRSMTNTQGCLVGFDALLSPRQKGLVSDDVSTRSGPVNASSSCDEPETLVAASEQLQRLTKQSAKQRKSSDPFPEVTRDAYAEVIEFARGGLGRVARAFDRRLSRVVALKELHTSSQMDERRFAREVRVTARLQHPGIVPIYEAGRWPNGDPFYAMKLISGDSLSTLIREASSLRDRLKLLRCIENVADTMAYAHSRGVIHRDLKPSNVVVGEFGETVVIDWGLAKVLRVSSEKAGVDWGDDDESELERDLGEAFSSRRVRVSTSDSISVSDAEIERVIEADRVALTMAGDVLGTPYFMSPEQAVGLSVDEKTDIWAVGAMLYNLIVGAPPFSDVTAGTPIERVRGGAPTPIEKRCPDVPAELRSIVERAMAYRPDERYGSVREIADELRRFQSDQLVIAHRYSPLERAARRLRKRALPLAIVAVAAVLLSAVGGVAAVRIGLERDRAEQRRVEAVAAGDEAIQAKKAAVRKQDELLLLQARAQLEQDPTLAMAALRGLSNEWGTPEDWARARDVAHEAALRGVAHVMPGHAGDVWAIDVASDGSIAVSASIDRTLRLWSLRDPNEPTSGSRVLTTTEQGQVAIALSREPTSPKWLYTAGLDRKVHRWSLHEQMNDLVLGEQRAIVVSLALSSDGRLLASGNANGDVVIWDVSEQPKELVRFVDQPGTVYALAFAPDAKSLLTIGQDGVLRIRDLATLKAREIKAHRGRAFALAVSSQGQIATAGADGETLLFSSLDAHDKRSLASGRGVVYALAFSRDGSRLASGGEDRRVFVESLASGARSVLRGHEAVHAASFLPSGELITSGEDRVLRRWPAKIEGTEVLLSAPPKSLSSVRRDGSVLVGLVDGRALALDAIDRPMRELARVEEKITALASSSDGEWVALGRANGRTLLIHGAEKREIASVRGTVYGLSFSGDGSHLAVVSESGELLVLDTSSKSHRVYSLSSSPLYDVSWSGSSRVVASGWDRHVRQVNLDTGVISDVGVHDDWALAVDASSPQHVVASTGADQTIRLWPLEGDASMKSLVGHTARVTSVAWIDEGRALVSAGDDRTVRRWSFVAPYSVESRLLPTAVHAVRASADGRQLYAIAGGALYVWRDTAPRGEDLRRWITQATNATIDEQGAHSK